MTDKECLEKIKDIQQKCLDVQRRAYQKKVEDTMDVLQAWANTSSPYKVSDIIVSGGEALEIISIKGMEGAKRDTLVRMYHCRVLTKTFRPRSDGKTMDIYDDGRDIRKAL